MAAAAVRAAKPSGVLPPASPFAELLRRSRFASYDPKVKQTYSAPPEYAHRGNWGLKRPIAQKRRDAYITLKNYEEHAQFIEWNNAEAQVRFVKRFEELNVTPNVPDSDFGRSLGANRSSIWLTDSEFDSAKDKEYRYIIEENAAAEEEEFPTSLDDLGKRGPGQYANPIPKSTISLRNDVWNYRQPNIDAMSPAEFEAYISKLRTLRPAFFERLRSELQAQASRIPASSTNGRGTSALLNPTLSDLKLAMSKVLFSNDHRAFLNDYFEREYYSRDDSPAAPDPESGESLPKDFVNPKIKPQPHRNGGLMYAHPSLLDTFFTTKPKPALVLQEDLVDGGKFASRSAPGPVPLLVSIGGHVSELDKPQHSSRVQPLFKRNSGPEEGVSDKNFLTVRVASVDLLDAPVVVGKDVDVLRKIHVKEQVKAVRENDRSTVPGSVAWVKDVPKDSQSMMNWGAMSGRPFGFGGSSAFRSAGQRTREGARVKKSKVVSQLREMGERNKVSSSDSSPSSSS